MLKKKTSASGEIQVLPELQAGTKTIIKMPIGEIDEQGQEEIWVQLYHWDLPTLPEWWEYSTQVGGKGEYVGSFCKRVAKYYWKTTKTKLNSDQLGRLGSLVSRHTDKNTEYIIDYTQDLHSWDAGDFGDGGSCFWTCNSAARDMLESDGAWAIRFYQGVFKPDKRFKKGYNSKILRGYGRAWICKRDNYYVVFNGYGLETAHIARIMANDLNLSYRKICLLNYGEHDGLLYINNSGYTIGYEADINTLSNIDLQIYYGLILCCRCARQIDEDEVRIYNNNEYCCECFNGEKAYYDILYTKID